MEIKLPKEKEKFVSLPEDFNEKALDNLKYMDTKNVTRLDSDDPIEMAVMASQTIWPATYEGSRPGTIILAAIDSWQLTLASANLIHHPNNGPILLIQHDSIPESTLNEIKRLQPKGNSQGTQLKIMGEVSDEVLKTLSEFNIDQITETNPAEFASKIDQFYADVAGELPEKIIIASSEEEARLYSTIAVNWIAHMPEPVLFVTKDEIPSSTKSAIDKRKNPVFYILGPNTVISEKVENELLEYGKVTRIGEEDPVSTAIAFTQFEDKEAQFGWGIDNPGHGFIFISTDTPEYALVMAPFSHLGKHAPMLWLENGKVTDLMARYLAKVKPTFTDSPISGPYNHGYLAGSQEVISFQVQDIVDSKLEIESLHGGGHGGH